MIFELNPKDVLNTQGRNIQTTRDPVSQEIVQQEMIHLRTVKEEERLRDIDKIWDGVGAAT